MGVKRAIDFRFPEREQSFTQGGNHLNTAADTWQTAIDISGHRGTMYLRHRAPPANWFTNLRVTIDGVQYPIQDCSKATRNGATWIFDFNLSVKIEHKCAAENQTRVEWAYHEYTP